MEQTVLFNPEEIQSPFDTIREVDEELFNVTVPDFVYHLKQIDDSGEVQLSAAIKKFLIPSDNCDEQGIQMYNLVVNATVIRTDMS